MEQNLKYTKIVRNVLRGVDHRYQFYTNKYKNMRTVKSYGFICPDTEAKLFAALREAGCNNATVDRKTTSRYAGYSQAIFIVRLPYK